MPADDDQCGRILTDMEDIYNQKDLEERIEKEEALLVYFSSLTCSVCKVLKPKVAELLESRYPRMNMYYVDIEKSPVISGQNRVFSIPTILIFVQGKEFARYSRNFSIGELEQQIDRFYPHVFE